MPSSPTHKNLDSLVEAPDSGTMRADNGKVIRVRIYNAKKSVCDANLLYYGTAGTGAETDFQVSSCISEAIGSEQGRLTVTWEGAGPGAISLPPDTVSVSGDNLSPRIERHPIFKELETQTVGSGTTLEDVLDVVENVVRAQDRAGRKSNLAKLAGNALALKLIKKIQRGNESFYLCSLRYTWTTHSWTRPTMYRGGWIESPGGPLAGYFAGDISWLREADDLQQSGGIWSLRRSWIGAVDTFWDSDIYPV